MWRLAVVAGALAATPAAAQQVTAEQAIANYEASMRTTVRRCPSPRDGEEVVVCARREDDRYRAPLYAAPDGGPATRAGGEQRAAMAAGDSRCSPVGRAQQCGGGLDVFGIAVFLGRALVAAVRGDD